MANLTSLHSSWELTQFDAIGLIIEKNRTKGWNLSTFVP